MEAASAPPEPPLTLRGARFAAASANHLAAEAAAQVLAAGGNAVDAGVAGALVLGVVQPEFVHFAGVAPVIVRLPNGEAWTVSGLGPWPALASVEVFRHEHGGAIPQGILRTVVPGAPCALITALARWGTLRFADAASQALAFARDGFVVSPFTHATLATLAPAILRYPENAGVLLRGGRSPAVGERLVQPGLATTLELMIAAEAQTLRRGAGREAALEAARAAFYAGDIAAAIDAHQRAEGGWLRREDLAAFRCEVEPALRTSFQGGEVLTCGYWCQGPVLAQALRLLDGIDLKRMGRNGVAYIHHVAEALKLAFADRHRWYGDPRFVDTPWDRLLADDYVAGRRRLIDPGRASPGMPEAGDLAPVREPALAEPDTCSLAVVDAEGAAFSTTPSDGCSGAPMAPGLGLVPSTRGVQGFTDLAHPGCVAPGKRPWLTPSPAIAALDDGRVLAFGTPGGDVQPQAMLQALLNVTRFGLSLEEAVDAPRFASASFPQAAAPHAYDPGRLDVEGRIPSAVVEGLGRLGHRPTPWQAYDQRAGGVSIAAFDPTAGRCEAAADRRRPSGVAGG